MAGPVMRFRSGSVSATVWENPRKDGTLFPSVKLTKSYRERQTQEWKDTSSFSVNDLPVVAILARKAFEALALDHAANGLASTPGPAASPEAEAEEDLEEAMPKRRRKG